MSNASYTPATAAYLTSLEPSLSFVDGVTPSTGATVVSTDATDPSGQVFVAVVASSSGMCFFVKDDASAGTTFGEIRVSAPTDCEAGNSAVVTFGPSW